MFFSIVMPLYNKESFVEQALSSILNQNYMDYEVVIINDGSTDTSLDVVLNWINQLDELARPKFKVYTQKNSGVSVSRNNGVIKCNYDYVAFLDCDDFWKEGHLDSLRQLVEKYSLLVDVFSSYCIQSEGNSYVYPKLGKYECFEGVIDYFEASLISNGFVHSSSVAVKKKALKSNPFPSDMKNFEDMITWAKLCFDRGFAFSSSPTAVYVIENARAALKVDFNSFILYEKRLLIDQRYNRGLYVYCFKFHFLHLMYQKMNLPILVFIKKGTPLLRRSFLFSFSFFLTLFFPKKLIVILKTARKKRVF